MKSLASRLLIAFCLIALFAIGVDWVLETTAISTWIFGKDGAWEGMRALAGAHMAVWIGIALVLLPLLAGSSWLLVGRDESIKARAKDGDLIRLSPEAIERSVSRAVRARVQEVIKVRSEARQGKRNSAFVRVHVAVVDAVPVPLLRSRVRAAAVEVLDRLLGLSDPNQVHVVVHDIQNAEGGPAPRRKRREKPAEAPKAAPKPVTPASAVAARKEAVSGGKKKLL